jgi:hypothetical protein
MQDPQTHRIAHIKTKAKARQITKYKQTNKREKTKKTNKQTNKEQNM